MFLYSYNGVVNFRCFRPMIHYRFRFIRSSRILSLFWDLFYYGIVWNAQTISYERFIARLCHGYTQSLNRGHRVLQGRPKWLTMPRLNVPVRPFRRWARRACNSVHFSSSYFVTREKNDLFQTINFCLIVSIFRVIIHHRFIKLWISYGRWVRQDAITNRFLSLISLLTTRSIGETNTL